MVAEVARCVFECDQGAGTHLAVSLATGGETQGLCALDFAGGSAPRTPGIARGVALHSCALDFAGGSAPRGPHPLGGFAPSGCKHEPCFSCECTNIDAAAMGDGRSVRLGAIHACMCLPESAPTILHE